MKTLTLAATRRRVALALLSFSILGLVSLFCGCSSFPAAEQVLFTAQTNSVPVVTNWTVTHQATNDLGTVETRNVVTWATNTETTVTYQVSTNATAIVQTGSRIGEIFSPGFGELAGVAVGGLLALWARIKSKKSGAVMAQGMETLLAVIETTKGKAFADTIKLRLVKDQNTAGVLREIAALVEATVDNEQAKAVARTMLEGLSEPAK